VKTILVQFRAMLQRLASDPAHNMVLVETQGTLAPGDWANELHPTGAGFARIAAHFRAALAARFAHRI
jgi:hypothetical protein